MHSRQATSNVQSDNANTVIVTAGPPTDGRLRNGSTDGRYWIRGNIAGFHYWGSSYLLGADADLAARALLNAFYSTQQVDDALCWVEWGRRYWRVNDGGHGGRWTLIVEEGYSSVGSLPADDDTDLTTQYGSISSATYAVYNGTLTNPIVGTENTGIDSPFGGKNTAIVSHYPYRDQPSTVSGPGSVQVMVNLAPYIADAPGQLPITGANMEWVELKTRIRQVVCDKVYPYDTQFGTSAVRPVYTDTDLILSGQYGTTALYTYIDPVTGRPGQTALIPVGKWVGVSSPVGAYNKDYSGLNPIAPALLVDNALGVYDVRARYRAVYSDGSVSVWHEDAGFFTYATYAGGPFHFHLGDADLLAAYPVDDSIPPAITISKLDWTFPVPPGALGYTAFVYEVGYGPETDSRGFLIEHRCYSLRQTDTSGRLVYSPANNPSDQNAGGWTVGLSVVWDNSTGKYPNGASMAYDEAARWIPAGPSGYVTGYPPASNGPGPDVGTKGGKYLAKYTGAVLSCPPGGAIIDKQGPYPSYTTGIVDVWFAMDSLPGAILQGFYNGSVEVGISDQTLNPFGEAYYADYGLYIFADHSVSQAAGQTSPDLPGRIVRGYDSRVIVGSAGGGELINYLSPHYALGPQRFYLDCDLNLTGITLSGGAANPLAAPIVAPFVLLPITSTDASMGTISLTDTQGITRAVNLYLRPPACTRINLA